MNEPRFQNWSCGLLGENISALSLHLHLKVSTVAPNTSLKPKMHIESLGLQQWPRFQLSG